MRQLTRDPSNNPWAERDARGDLIDRLEAAIIQWAEAEDSLVSTVENPLSTLADITRWRERREAAARHLRSLVPDLSEKKQARTDVCRTAAESAS